MVINGRHWARRVATAMGVGACMVLLAAAPVLAKVPFFSVEMTPREPVAGEPILITVRTWQDLAHTVPEPFDAPHLNRLLVLRSTEGTSSIGIALEAEAPGRFQGTITVPTAGEWTLVAFSDRSGWSSPEVPTGYPDTITLTLRRETDLLNSVLLIGGIAAAIGLAGLGVLALGSRRLRRHAVHRSIAVMASQPPHESTTT